jgi:hypothetical protein
VDEACRTAKTGIIPHADALTVLYNAEISFIPLPHRLSIKLTPFTKRCIMPDTLPPIGRRFFSIDEANKMLPLIRHIVEEIGTTAKKYERLQTKLDLTNDFAPSEEERRHLEVEYAEQADRLEDCLQELRTLGVEFKGWEGLVDFPAWVDGREIEYCWKMGEGAVTHWHEIYAGFSNRKPLPVTAAITPQVILGDAYAEEYTPDDVTKVTPKKKSKSRAPVMKRGEEMI